MHVSVIAGSILRLSNMRQIAKLLKLVTMSSLIIILTLWSSQLVCAGVTRIAYGKPVRVQISNRGLNQLEFGRHIVTKLWGDDRRYQAHIAPSGSQLFISTNRPAGEEIALAAALAGGEVVNLVLEVKSLPEGKLAKLQIASNKEEIKEFLAASTESRESKAILKEQAKLMLRSMQAGSKGVYQVKNLRKEINIMLFNSKLLKLQGRLAYYDHELEGYYFIMSNEALGKQGVSSERLAEYFPGSLLVATVNKELAAGEQSKLFIIRQKN